MQSSHFIEAEDGDTMERVTFYGHEKNETTARLAQINLAVHGLEGKIRAGNEAITYYKDPHELVGECDFVMANPPFNVDEVDAEKGQGRQAAAIRPAGREQGQEGLERQLSVASVLLQLPERERPRRHRDVIPGLQLRARRGQGAPEAGRDRRRRRDDRYPRQLLLHPHGALPALVSGPFEGTGRGPGATMC